MLSRAMTDFDDKFGHAAALLFRNWARVQTFLRVAELGMPHAEMILREEADNLLSASDGSSKSFVEYMKQVGSAGYAELQLNDAQAAVDAAALIFMHSVLDDAAMKCCRLIALAKPHEWERWVDDKQAPLKEVREHGYDSLFDKALKRPSQQARVRVTACKSRHDPKSVQTTRWIFEPCR